MSDAGTILAIDDSPASSAPLIRILTAAGYQVRRTGSDALALGGAVADPPDLILLDVRVNGTDGLDMVRRLKARAETKAIPIILLGAHADPREWAAGLRSGAADRVTRPFLPEELLSRIRTQLSLHRTTVALDRQAEALRLATGSLEAERAGRRRAEEALREDLERAERSRLALLSILEDRQRAEGTLQLQAAALNAAAHAMIITDRTGGIEWINDAFTRLTGYEAEEALHRNARDLVKSGAHDAAFYRNMWETILAGGAWSGEVTNRRKDGSLYPEALTITPVRDARGAIAHFIALKRDLTEERRQEAQFLQAQKMEGVGRLAGGIAHDFNNLLTVMITITDLALWDLKPEDPLFADLKEIRGAADRAAVLTRQLLAFGRKQVLQPKVVDLGATVGQMQGMLRRAIPEDIELTVAADADLGSVVVDPGQIEQVIVNLTVNARDAMPDGGSLAIEVRNVDLDEAYAATHPSVRPGPHVMLAITDSGVGMDAGTREHAFEPYFTTKGVGKGTGLGLSTAYGIVRQSGGDIAVSSEPGRGTSFRILLPRVAARPGAAEPAAAVALARGTETILIVEDEAAVRQMAGRVLLAAGYTVLTAENGREARGLLETHGGPVDLMLTDVVMPGMGGRDLASQARIVRPAMRIVFTSGYTDDVILRNDLQDGAADFIGKPYTAALLTRKVREALDAPRDGPKGLVR